MLTLREMGFTMDEIKHVQGGVPEKELLQKKTLEIKVPMKDFPKPITRFLNGWKTTAMRSLTIPGNPISMVSGTKIPLRNG